MTAAAVSGLRSWWFRPEPLARVAVLRTLVYLYVPADLYVRTAQVVPHAYGSPDLYKPVDLLRLLHQPAPAPWFAQTLRVVIIATSLLAAAGLWPRAFGIIVALAYADWACLAMSYGKVDHDHLAILVAVAVLPTVPDVSWRSSDRSEAAGWALRCIEIGVVATYFLAACAKMRFGGWHWPNGAIFAWAIVRRGTPLARPLLHHPTVLLLAQWGLLMLEASTPALLFLRQRWRVVGVAGLLLFHFTTWLTITINFAPLVVCLLVFVPLERITAATRGLLSPRVVRRAASR
jgi:vitamin K-dependent gamma-carboxylase-like protein